MTEANFTTRALRVVNGLEQAALLDRQGNDDEADTLLQGLREDVGALQTKARAMCNDAASQELIAQRGLRQTLNAIAETRSAEEKAQYSIDKLQAAEDGDEAALDEAVKQGTSYLDKMVDLQAQINELSRQIRENAQRVKDYWWVPGYGLYAAIQSLQDLLGGKEGDLESAIRGYQEIGREVSELTQDTDRLKERLVGLKRQLADLHVSEDELKAQEAALEQQQKSLAVAIVTASTVGSFYDELGVSLRGTKDELDSAYGMADRLADSVEIIGADGRLHPGTLKDALTYLADQADRPPIILQSEYAECTALE
ncbi:MAG TPA: hypothetical protein VF759_07210 [Allosphingosinicella sp.]|jgi:DNA repair exonuclease SbcCD ATPase subunit